MSDEKLSELEEPNVLCGPRWEDVGPGTEAFGRLLKSLQTSANRIGGAARGDTFMFTRLPRELIRAQEKLATAHRLILGAHALLREKHLRDAGHAALSKAKEREHG